MGHSMYLISLLNFSFMSACGARHSNVFLFILAYCFFYLSLFIVILPYVFSEYIF